VYQELGVTAEAAMEAALRSLDEVAGVNTPA
jgi:hypothetical protein